MLKRGMLVVAGLLMMAVGPCVSRPVVDGAVATPAVMTWVNADAGLNYPYAFYWDGNGGEPIYVDPATGYIWSIYNGLSGAPTLGGTTLETGLYFTTSDCTGTAYVLTRPNDLPNIVYTISAEGSYWVAAGAASVTTGSQLLFGGCGVSVQTGNIYNGVGPLTPPTLPAGPWVLLAQ